MEFAAVFYDVTPSVFFRNTVSGVPDKGVSGIYAIVHITTGRAYIGQAQCIRVRWQSHRTTLKGDRHHSYLLQRAWDKYGPDAFAFVVVDLCDIADLNEREKAWLDWAQSYVPGNGFNIAVYPDSATRGRKHSSETIAKMRKAAVRTPEQIEAIRIRMTGNVMSEATKQKIRDARVKQAPTYGMLGRKMSHETKALMSEAARKPKTAEHAANISKGKKGVSTPAMREAGARRRAKTAARKAAKEPLDTPAPVV